MTNIMQMLNTIYISLCIRFDEFKREERGAVDIVAIVVMIGIAVLLAVAFRRQISSLLTSLFSTITTNATDAINE